MTAVGNMLLQHGCELKRRAVRDGKLGSVFSKKLFGGRCECVLKVIVLRLGLGLVKGLRYVDLPSSAMDVPTLLTYLHGFMADVNKALPRECQSRTRRSMSSAFYALVLVWSSR